jgi:hypothetical protein
MATEAQRTHVVHVLDHLHTFASHLLYPAGDQRTNRDGVSWRLSETQAFAMLAGGGYWQGDCSEFCPWVLKCAGLWRWVQPGATSTHLELLPVHYHDARGALPGALVVFGPGGGHHEAIVHTADPAHGNPLLASHGRPGYDLVRLHDLAAAQAAEGYPGTVLLSIAHL